MFAFLKNVVSELKKSAKRKSAPARRSVPPSLECLESRQLLSATIGGGLPTPINLNAPMAQVQTLQPSNINQNVAVSNLAQSTISLQPSAGSILSQGSTLIYRLTHQVPSLAGVNFAMTSQTNGGQYSLLIQQQTDHFGGSASFTGVWGATSQTGGKPVTGTLEVEPGGAIAIQFSWTQGSVNHSFVGTITPDFAFLGYHIDGNVTVTGGSNSGGPGHLIGNGQVPLLHHL